MNFKKYNFIFIFMIALVIAIPIISVSKRSNSPSADINDELPPVIEVDTDDKKPSKQTTYKFDTAWQAYTHIVNSTLTQSYRSDTTQSLKATANVGVSMTFDQNVSIKTYVSKDGKILEETYSGGTKKFFNSTYYDGNNIYAKTVNGSFAVGQKPNFVADKMSLSDFLNEQGVMPGFIMSLSKKHFGNLKPIREKVGYYSFTVNVTDRNLFGDYLKKINCMSGSEKFPSINAFSMKFVYSTKTGKLIQLKLTESYDIKYMGIDVTCSSQSVRNFYEVGTDVQFPSLSYMGL